MKYAVVFVLAIVWIVGIDMSIPKNEFIQEEFGQIDDAYISYRYAANLLRGDGLVYNKGERVEGFTNMLWVLLLALISFVVSIDLPQAGYVLSVISGSMLLTAIYGLTYHISKNKWVSIFPVLLVGLTIHFNTWVLSGLETPLWAALIVLGIWAAMSNRMILASLLAGLCFWTRPDGGLLGVSIFLPYLWKRWEESDSLKKLLRKEWEQYKWFNPIIIWCVMIVGLTIFRLVYFGSPVPNTAVAKIGGIPVSRGLEYLTTTLRDGGIVFLIPVYILIFGFGYRRSEISLFVLLQTTYTVAIGGDAFYYGRFLIPVMALLSCGWGYIYKILKEKEYMLMPAETHIWYKYVVPVFCILYLSLIHFPVLNDDEFTKEKVKNCNFERFNRENAKNYNNETIACIGIGSFGYYNPNVRILDMVGLVTPEVSHNNVNIGDDIIPGHHRSNAKWILSQNPDEIHLPDSLSLPCVVDMKELEEFHQKYKRDQTKLGIWIRK